MEYKDYLHTGHWKSTRRNHYRNPNNRKCDVCGWDLNLHIHHKTYKNLWKEKKRNLVTLCNVCHDEVHKLLNRRLSDNITLDNAHKILRKHMLKRNRICAKGLAKKIYIPKTKKQRKREKLEQLKKENFNMYKATIKGYKYHKYTKDSPNPNWTS